MAGPQKRPSFEQLVQEIDRLFDRGRQIFWDLGKRLKVLRDSEAYLEEYSTFAECCRDKWMISRRHANRLIAGADVVALIEAASGEEGVSANPGPTGPDGGAVLPTRERHTRLLTKIKDDDDRVAAWQEAVDAANGRPTLRHIKAAVDRRLTRKTAKPKAKLKAKTPGPGPRPEHVEEDDTEIDPIAEWERAEEEVNRLNELVADLQSDDLAGKHKALSERYGRLEGHLDATRQQLRQCDGHARYQGRLLKQIRETLGLEKNTEILPAVRDLLR